MATLRNKTTSEGVIVWWKSHPDLNSPKTYQVKEGAVSFLADLGYKVPTPGDETEVPSDVCHPLRILEDLYFKSGGSGDTSGKQIKKIDEGYSETLSEAQRKKLEKYVEGHDNRNIYSKKLNNGNSSLSSKNNDANSNRRKHQSQLQEKDKIIDEVDRISLSENGIIETEDGHINVGDITSDAVGKEIEIKMITSNFGICLTESVRNEGYADSFREICPSLSDEAKIPETEQTVACLNCGSVATKNGEMWVCGVCESEFYANESGVPIPRKDSDETELPNVGRIIKNVSLAIDSKDNLCSKRNDKIKINGSVSSSETVQVKIQCRREDYVVGAVVDSPESDGSDQQSLEELRKKAEESAVDDFSGEVTESTSTIIQYSRSQEVKDYVMARADGTCEGCGEPAPFRSKTGEPYLHAHHIYELSEGGSDAPDTVIALCPNCHYRVHHGDDGEEYNQELSSKIQKLENGGA